MKQKEGHKNEYDEINLADYIKIILKRKNLILGFFLAGIIIAGAFATLSLKTYKVETLIEIGVIEEDLLVEKPLQLIEKIRGSIYGDYPGIEANNPAKTNLVKIEIISRSPEDAKKSLENINESILTDHNNRIKPQIDIVEKHIEKLKKDIDFLIPMNQQIAELQLEVYDLQKKIENFQPTKIIQEPTISEMRLSLILNLIIGGILGIFLGIILAFGKEWWDKNKSKI